MRLKNFKIIFTLHILYQITNLFLSPLLLTSFFFFFLFYKLWDPFVLFFMHFNSFFLSPSLIYFSSTKHLSSLHICFLYLFSLIYFIFIHPIPFFSLLKRTLTHQRREREGGGKRGKDRDERWFDAKEDEWTLKSIR